MREYIAESPKQVRKGFNYTEKTIYFSYLPIIYLWYIHMYMISADLYMHGMHCIAEKNCVYFEDVHLKNCSWLTILY